MDLTKFTKKRYRGITWKYIKNVAIVSFAVVIVAVAAISVFMRVYFYDHASQILKKEAWNAQISVLRSNINNDDEFVVAAKLFIESYDKKDVTQARIFSAEGKEIVSSGGIVYNTDIPNDVKTVLTGTVEESSFTGKNNSGENIMSYTCSLRNASGEMMGIINISSSLEGIQGQLRFLIGITVLAGVLIILFVLLAGEYFVASIVRPVVNVSNASRKIALGDFTVRLTSANQDDEIGALCESINYMAKELGQAEKVKNDFISSISHELRTPLTAIKGWAETVKDTDNPEITKKGMDIISNETMRLSRLVEELLDFSHLQKDEFSINFERVDIVAELSAAAYMYENQAAQSGIELVYAEPNDVAFVIGDRDRLRQVFINIIDNAVKYSKKGGRVTILTGIGEKAIKIIVSDEGYGIPANELDNVKQKFYKVNQSVKGSGIGLAVADEIISRHNGSLDIQSVENEGTTVTITLPLDTSDVSMHKLNEI